MMLPMFEHVTIAFPELGPLPWWVTDYLTGSDDDIVEALASYAARNVAHVMIWCATTGTESLAKQASIIRSIVVHRLAVRLRATHASS
jgi:hypothetical protein